MARVDPLIDQFRPRGATSEFAPALSTDTKGCLALADLRLRHPESVEPDRERTTVLGSWPQSPLNRSALVGPDPPLPAGVEERSACEALRDIIDTSERVEGPTTVFEEVGRTPRTSFDDLPELTPEQLEYISRRWFTIRRVAGSALDARLDPTQKILGPQVSQGRRD